MNRYALPLVAIAGLFLAAALFAGGTSSRPTAVGAATPVVVELFTSEGCSSCPPADALLQKYDTQPFPRAQLIVLSEHVDYWNHIGWTDPYSSPAYSERQNAYGSRLQLESVYTPQMIVDGTDEFVGSSSSDAHKAFNKAAAVVKIPVRIAGAKLDGNIFRAHVETGTLPDQLHKADVVLVVALNHAESQVVAGENSGRRLAHVAVVRSLVKAGSLETGQTFSQDVAVNLGKRIDPAQLRVIAFVQEPGPGKILGAAMEKLSQ